MFSVNVLVAKMHQRRKMDQSPGGREGDRSMFSVNVLVAKMRQLAEKWTSPRPPREPLPGK